MRRSFTTCLVGVAAALTVLAAAPARGPVTFALTGDSIITRKLSVYSEPEFVRLMDLIRGADVGFTNLEMLCHDYESPPGRPTLADPALARQILDNIVARSQPFNTRITIENGVGRVVLSDIPRSNP